MEWTIKYDRFFVYTGILFDEVVKIHEAVGNKEPSVTQCRRQC